MDMPPRPAPRFGLTAKLLVLNLLIFIVFGIIAMIMFRALHRVRDMSANIIDHEMPAVIGAARTGREISRIFGRASLLLGGFTGDALPPADERARLLASAEQLSAPAADPQLESALGAFTAGLKDIFDQCEKINAVTMRVHRIDDTINHRLAQLETRLSEEKIDPALMGERAANIDQIAMAAIAYREILLRARLGFMGLKPVSDDTRDVDPLFSLLSDFSMRLRPLLAANPVIARIGDALLDDALAYQDALVTLNNALIDFRLELMGLNRAMEAAEAAVSQADAQRLEAIRSMRDRNRKAMADTLSFVHILSAGVILLFGAFTYYFFLIHIRRPADAICAAIRKIGNGDMETRIRLGRRDEWDVIEKALNEMVSEIRDTYSQLYHKNDALQRAHQELKANMGRLETEIAERERLQRQLVHAQKMEAVGTLAGGVAHDFNNLLQGIQGYVELLMIHAPADSSTHRKLAAIETSVDRGRDLVRRLLTFARKVEGNPRPLDLNAGIRHVIKLLERALPRMVRIITEEQPDLMPIHADPAQLEQALMNLAVNAKDAMPDGGTLTIGTENVLPDEAHRRAHPEAKAGPHVLLRVSDTGAGMTPEILENIYDPFFTTKPVGKGTGLGLAMVFGIVRDHGGHMTCDSAPGRGTTFSIYLPAMEGPMPAAPSSREAASETGSWSLSEVRTKTTAETTAEATPETTAKLGSASEAASSAPPETGPAPTPDGGGPPAPAGRPGAGTILVVDDEPLILDYASQALSRMGHEVITAESGEAALEIQARLGSRIDLVILDLNMPGMGGWRCLSELLRARPSIRVIVASGFSEEGSEKQALKAGALAFAAKPYRLSALAESVGLALSNENGRGDGEKNLS